MSQTQSEKSPNLQDQESQSEVFNPNEKQQTKKSKSKSKRTNQSEPKQAKVQAQKKQKKKGGKKKEKQEKADKAEKVEKEKSKIQPAKRKPKSKKDAGGKDAQQNKATVLQYMKKQNRPYNLLNVFDNLHGKIKKPELETILNELTEQGEFQCKQFGKNKVYFLNQDKFDLDMKQVQQLSSTYTKLKEKHQELRQENKTLNDEYRKLMAKKTFDELEKQVFDLVGQIGKLKKKSDSLVSGEVEKVDEEQVKKIEKDSGLLEKQLNKRRRLVKQCLSAWSQVTEKKVSDIADEMGIELL